MAGTLLFDLDGTLTDPKRGITRCIQFAMREIGEAVPPADDLTWCIGPPLLASLETLTGDQDRARRALDLYRERFTAEGLYENRLYDDIPAALATLRATGHRLIVATSKPTVFAVRVIRHFGLEACFEAVHGSELDGRLSDKRELLAWIAAHHHLDVARTVMIGDRRHDIDGARENRMASIGVLYGYGSRDELLAAGANIMCDAPRDIPNGVANLIDRT
jgi:phosphoglycolate phosphatase